MGTGVYVLFFLLALSVVFAAASVFLLLLLRFFEERRDIADTQRLQAAQRKRESPRGIT